LLVGTICFSGDVTMQGHTVDIFN